MSGSRLRATAAKAANRCCCRQDREEFSRFLSLRQRTRHAVFYAPATRSGARAVLGVHRAIAYRGPSVLAREIEIFRAATSIALGGCLPHQHGAGELRAYRDNEFYKSEEEFVFRHRRGDRTEYETIVNAGFLLQVDDAWLPALWDRIGIQMGLEAFRSAR